MPPKKPAAGNPVARGSDDQSGRAKSDRMLPRSLRMMQGFGANRFKLIDKNGNLTRPVQLRNGS